VRGKELLPVHSWLGHTSSITSIAICPSETDIPLYAVTGGLDRYYKFWDLRDTSVPLQEVRRDQVTDVSWLPSLPAVAVSYDVYKLGPTQTVITESECLNNRAFPVIGQNSAVWGQTVSPWLGSLAVCTSAGEVILFVLPPKGPTTTEQSKSYGKRRAYVYRTENKINDSASLLDCSDFDSLKGRCTLHYLDVWDGKDMQEKKELERVRLQAKMPAEELTAYPLVSINRAAWNPNLGAQFWLASGGQAGMLRVHSLESLNTVTVREAVKSFVKKNG
jgi:WD40 repeat protein